jgi:hypothetical protein
MNEIATFFRPRGKDAGATYHFGVRPEKGPSQQFSVYCRDARRLKGLNPEEAPKDWNANAYYDSLKNDVKGRGGGIIVRASGDGPSKTLEVENVASGKAQPSQYVLLAPGRPAYLHPIADRQNVPAASHAIVPVDEESERRLVTFVEQLPWFSPDFEALVLNAIRRPTLDSRLDNVETQLFGETAETARNEANARGWARFRIRMEKLLSKSSTYGFAAAGVLVILGAANAWILYDLNSRIPTSAVISAGGNKKLAVETTDTSNSNPADAPGTATTPLVAATQQLLKELNKKKSTDRIKTLYESHFQGFADKQNLSDGDIERWFATQPSSDGSDSRPLLWGLIKLQTLKTNPRQSDINYLQGAGKWSASKVILDNMRVKLGEDRVGQRLIAALSCRLGYDNTQTPTLPKSDSSDALNLMPGTQCSDLTDEDIAKGLTQLIGFVKTLK